MYVRRPDLHMSLPFCEWNIIASMRILRYALSLKHIYPKTDRPRFSTVFHKTELRKETSMLPNVSHLHRQTLRGLVMSATHLFNMAESKALKVKQQEKTSRKSLSEAVIAQAMEDLWDKNHRQESIDFFTGDGFKCCAEMANMSLYNQLKLVRIMKRAAKGPDLLSEGI